MKQPDTGKFKVQTFGQSPMPKGNILSPANAFRRKVTGRKDVSSHCFFKHSRKSYHISDGKEALQPGPSTCDHDYQARFRFPALKIQS